MNRYIVGAIAGLASAGTAAASPFGHPGLLDGSNFQSIGASSLTAHSIETGELVYSGSSPGFALASVLEGVTYASGIWPDDNGPFIAAFSGSVLRDDYTKDASVGGTSVMTEFQFVGGVATAGETVEFFFLDENEDLVDGFSVALPQGGNFIWTINLRDGDGKPIGYQSAASGFVQSQHADEGTFTWFATNALHVGSNVWSGGSGDGEWDTTMYAFAITSVIPAPGALALLGLAGFFGTSRRRQS